MGNMALIQISTRNMPQSLGSYDLKSIEMESKIICSKISLQNKVRKWLLFRENKLLAQRHRD